MNRHRVQSIAVNGLCLLPFIAALGLIFFRLQPQNQELGHDYFHYFVRIYLGAMHFWQNGLATPHYTPSLCGGMPFFADPQSVYHSLQQFLAFFIPPLLATHITFLVFYLLAYAGMWFLLSSVLRFSSFVSHLGALLFSLNGFTFAHIYVGHVTHYPFLLAPWIFYALFKNTHRLDWKLVSIFVLSICCTFYTGGLHVLVIFALTFIVLLPTLIYWKYEHRKLRQLGVFLVIGLGAIILSCSGKFAAGLLFSPHFVKGGVDSSGLPLHELVLRYFWPNPRSIPAYILFGKWAFGPWEYVAFVSRVCVPGVLACFVAQFFSMRLSKFLVILSTMMVAYFVVIVAMGTDLNLSLPFFRGYHNPIKILTALSFPMILATAYAAQKMWDRFRMDQIQPLGVSAVYFLAGGIFLSEYAIQTNVIVDNPMARRYFFQPEVWSYLKRQNALIPVRHVVASYHSDLQAIATGCSSLRCYEPLFGYRREHLFAKVSPGESDSVSHGTFNLTHPGCLLYPKELGCNPWDRISVSERANFERFRSGFVVWDWVPRWQTYLIRLNAFVIFLLTVILIGPGLVWLWKWVAEKLSRIEQVPVGG